MHGKKIGMPWLKNRCNSLTCTVGTYRSIEGVGKVMGSILVLKRIIAKRR